jgi:hypothetical protein
MKQMSHVFFISRNQIVYAHMTNGAVDNCISESVRYFPQHKTQQHEISDVISSIVGRISRNYRATDTFVIIYGSPWSHTALATIPYTKQFIERTIDQKLRQILTDEHGSQTIHGAQIPTHNTMLALSTHAIGYEVAGTWFLDIDQVKLITADALFAIDWIDTGIHKAVTGALYPWYLQAQELVITSLEGVITSWYMTHGHHEYDAVIVVGADSTSFARMVPDPLVQQFHSIPFGYNGEPVRGEYITDDPLPSEYIFRYQQQVRNVCDKLFPESVINPRIAIICEPHQRAHNLVAAITEIEDIVPQGVPVWELPRDLGPKEWISDLWKYIT